MPILSEKSWEKHSNKWSGWSRVLAMPLIGSSLYLHNWFILLLSIAWIIINPFIFSKPQKIDNWMSKGVIGEKIYYSEKRYFRLDLPTALNLINIPLFTAFIYFAWKGQLTNTILSGLLVMIVKFWFIDRMVSVYEKR
jgi:hypothetical protein